MVILTSAEYEFSSWGDNYIIVQRGLVSGVVNMASNVVLLAGFREISKSDFGAVGIFLAKAFISKKNCFYDKQLFKCAELNGGKAPRVLARLHELRHKELQFYPHLSNTHCARNTKMT